MFLTNLTNWLLKTNNDCDNFDHFWKNFWILTIETSEIPMVMVDVYNDTEDNHADVDVEDGNVELSTWLHTFKVRSRSHRASGWLSNVPNVETFGLLFIFTLCLKMIMLCRLSNVINVETLETFCLHCLCFVDFIMLSTWKLLG